MYRKARRNYIEQKCRLEQASNAPSSNEEQKQSENMAIKTEELPSVIRVDKQNEKDSYGSLSN